MPQPLPAVQRHNTLRKRWAVPRMADKCTLPIIIIIIIIINLACDARLDIHARGFWERQKSTFFDIRVCHPNADSYKDRTPEQVYRLHENEKKRMYERRVLEVEQASFTPLVFTTTGGMGRECLRYHSRLAELISVEKGEDYAKTLTWIRGKVSFSILRSALLCLRGSRSNRRRTNVKDIDVEVELARSHAR